MFWSENTNKEPITESNHMVDASIRINCKEIPIDHSYELSQQLLTILPWLEEDKRIAVHQIYIPASGNGWQRPENEHEAKMQLSRRSRLKIRLPKASLSRLEQITGKSISLAGETMRFGDIKTTSIPTSSTLVSRYVYIEEAGTDEEAFLQQAYSGLTQRGLKISKMLCGKTVYLQTPSGNLLTRSLMLAEMSPEDSLTVQEQGFTENRLMGCGIFIPQKGIKAVNDTDD